MAHTDHATWVSLNAADLEALRGILEQTPTQIYGYADDAKRLTAVLDQFTAPEAGDAVYRELAAELPFVRDGECEIDDHAVTSASDEGAYVMAWVWVERPDEAFQEGEA